MSAALVLREAAFGDIDAAEGWYESKEPGLGGRFVDEVERTLALIAENPGAYPAVENTTVRTIGCCGVTDLARASAPLGAARLAQAPIRPPSGSRPACPSTPRAPRRWCPTSGRWAEPRRSWPW